MSGNNSARGRPATNTQYAEPESSFVRGVEAFEVGGDASGGPSAFARGGRRGLGGRSPAPRTRHRETVCGRRPEARVGVDQLDLLGHGHRVRDRRGARFEEVGDRFRRVERGPAGRGTPVRPRTGARRRRRTRRTGECRGHRWATRCSSAGDVRPSRPAARRAGVSTTSPIERSPAAGLADQPVQDPGGDGAAVLGGRTDVVDRLRARAARASAARSAVSGVGGAPSSTASVAVGADRRGRHRPERQPDVAPDPRAAVARVVAPAERHHDLADRLGTARADLPEPTSRPGRRTDPDRGATARPARARSAGTPARTRRRRIVPLAARPRRRRRRRPSRAGPAACRRRATRSRCCRRRATVLDLGRTDGRGRLDQRRQCRGTSADRRISVYVVSAPRTSDRRRSRDAAELVEPPEIEHPVGRLTDLARDAGP